MRLSLLLLRSTTRHSHNKPQNSLEAKMLLREWAILTIRPRVDDSALARGQSDT